LNDEPITVYGTGEQTRDFTYIDDVIEATLKLAKLAKGCGIYNISNEHEHSIKELAEKLVAVCDSKSEIIYINPPKNRYDFEVERRFGSSQKLFETTGYKPNTPLEVGLRKIYEYLMLKGSSESP